MTTNLTSTKEAYEYALSLLARREHFVRELETKLLMKGAPSTVVEEVTARLTQEHYLDDRRAAEQFILEGKRKKKGLLKLLNELRLRGVETTAEELRNLYPREEEKQNAVVLLTKLRGATRQKRYRHLYNRGFSSDIIRELLPFS